LHQYDGRFFPGSGSVDEVGWGNGFGYSVNVGLPRHTGDASYVGAFEAVVPRALRRYRPQVILLNFGVDGHFADPLVRLWLSTAAYRAVATTIHDLAHELCAGRLLVFGSGGYDPQHAARCWATLLAVLAEALPVAPDAWPGRFAALEDRERPLPDPAVAPAVRATVERVCDSVLPLLER
jgi:acetoin utilization protein AcuC